MPPASTWPFPRSRLVREMPELVDRLLSGQAP